MSLDEYVRRRDQQVTLDREEDEPTPLGDEDIIDVVALPSSRPPPLPPRTPR